MAPADPAYAERADSAKCSAMSMIDEKSKLIEQTTCYSSILNPEAGVIEINSADDASALAGARDRPVDVPDTRFSPARMPDCGAAHASS